MRSQQRNVRCIQYDFIRGDRFWLEGRITFHGIWYVLGSICCDVRLQRNRFANLIAANSYSSDEIHVTHRRKAIVVGVRI